MAVFSQGGLSWTSIPKDGWPAKSGAFASVGGRWYKSKMCASRNCCPRSKSRRPWNNIKSATANAGTRRW